MTKAQKTRKISALRSLKSKLKTLRTLISNFLHDVVKRFRNLFPSVLKLSEYKIKEAELFHISLIIGAFLMIAFIGCKKTELAIVVAIVTFTFMTLYNYCAEEECQITKNTSSNMLVKGE